jgi:hypothetical protein
MGNVKKLKIRGRPPVQKTATGLTIPVPKKDAFLRDLGKASRPQDDDPAEAGDPSTSKG